MMIKDNKHVLVCCCKDNKSVDTKIILILSPLLCREAKCTASFVHLLKMMLSISKETDKNERMKSGSMLEWRGESSIMDG